MNKTRFGLTANALAALIFTAGLMGLTPVVLLVGAVLLVEENEWLKRMSVKALAFLLIMNVVSVLLMLLPDLLEWIVDIIRICDDMADVETIIQINKVFAWINSALGILTKVLLVVYAYQAYLGKYAKVLFVENMVNKNM